MDKTASGLSRPRLRRYQASNPYPIPKNPNARSNQCPYGQQFCQLKADYIRRPPKTAAMTTNYAFSDDTQEGILLPQRIRKSDLAFFYGRTPDYFCREIDPFIDKTAKKYYDKYEVQIIFKEFGSISRFEVDNAMPRIEQYRRRIRIKNIKQKK